MIRPQLLQLPKVADQRGNLTFLQYPVSAPFEIKRIFYLYGMPDGAQRGGHAHKIESQLLIALTGSFEVKIYDGNRWESYILDRPDVGLLIPPPFWRELHHFTPGAVCLTLSSTEFDPDEYLSPMEEYLEYLADS